MAQQCRDVALRFQQAASVELSLRGGRNRSASLSQPAIRFHLGQIWATNFKSLILKAENRDPLCRSNRWSFREDSRRCCCYDRSPLRD